MKIRPVAILAVAVCLARDSWAQDVWPGIAVKSGTTGVGAERITYGNGRFLVTSAVLFAPPGGTTATSTDGFHWTVHRVTNDVIVGGNRHVSPGNNNFVAWGFDLPVTNGLIQFSDDGLVWGQPVLIPSVPLTSGLYANGVYVAVGKRAESAAIVTSLDGIAWNSQTFPGYGPLNSITRGAGTIVAVGNAGAVFTSTNGLDWLTQVITPSANIYSVVYGNGLFEAVGDPPGILTSADGTNWVIRTSPLSWEITYGNGLFVGISNDINVSTDGVNWTRIWEHPGASIDLVGVVYGAGTFNVLIGGGNLMNVSPQAIINLRAETNGVIDFTVTGGWLGQSCRLQAATNFPATDWVDLFTFTNQGSVTYLQDTSATNYSQRFYRVAMP